MIINSTTIHDGGQVRRVGGELGSAVDEDVAGRDDAVLAVARDVEERGLHEASETRA